MRKIFAVFIVLFLLLFSSYTKVMALDCGWHTNDCSSCGGDCPAGESCGVYTARLETNDPTKPILTEVCVCYPNTTTTTQIQLTPATTQSNFYLRRPPDVFGGK